MRNVIALVLALIAGCTTFPTTAPSITPPAIPSPYGLTIEEEAAIVRLEDRRELDPAVASAWITHENPLHRARMALALGRIGPFTFVDANGNGEKEADEKQAGVDLLASLTGDSSVDVRRNAAFALGEIGDPAGVTPLLVLAADQNHADVAAEAVEALAKMAGTPVALASYEPLTLPSAPMGARARAIRYLFRFNDDTASAVAARSLAEDSSAIRQEAAYALSRRVYAPARDRLHVLLGDLDTLTRSYAARALGLIGEPASLTPLLQALADPHPWVRTNAARSIAQLLVRDPSLVRRATIAEDVVQLITATDDPDPGTRVVVLETLGFYASASQLAARKLDEVLANGSRWQREIALAALARHLGDDAEARVTELLKSAEPAGKRLVLDVTAPSPRGARLRRLLSTDPDASVRASAIGAIPDESVDAEVDLVRSALSDPDVVVRANAIDRYALQKKDSSADTLAALQRAEENARRDVMNDARFAAIRAIAEKDFPERESLVRTYLADSDPMIRRAAAELVQTKLGRNRPQYTPLPVDRPMSEYEEIVRWSREPHTASIHMPRGIIELVLLTQDAPLTTWNFATLARRGYFDNTSFMRVVPNFVIQGGDPRNDMNGGPGYSIRDEINLQKYTRGAVGMALSGPDTGGSQYFITHSRQPHLDGGYTIFGRVVDGMGSVVDQVERGEKVNTITIDEKQQSDPQAVSEVQKTPLPVEIGTMTADRLRTIVPEYQERETSYAPDAAVLEMLAASIQPGDRVEVYLGTWCDDSQREVPKLLKIARLLDANHSMDLPLTFVAVDRTKKQPTSLTDGRRIEKVATFIYYRGASELGRIVETPASLFEDDLLQLAVKTQ